MTSIYKKLDPNSVSVISFPVFKSLAASSGSRSNVTLFRGKHYGGQKQIDSAWPTSSNGEYQYLIHDSIRHLYYNKYNKVEENISNNLQNLSLYDKFVLFGAQQNSFGEGIKRESVIVTIYGSASQHTLIDDGLGNLIDTTISASYSAPIDHIQQGSVCKWNFADAYEFQTGTGFNSISEQYLRDLSGFNNHLYLHDIIISTSSYGQVSFFKTTTSKGTAINNQSFNFRSNEDFSIICTIMIPSSSRYDNIDYETIITKNKGIYVSGSNANSVYPFDISVLKDSINYGKIQFTRFDGENKSQIISSSSLNDGVYHMLTCQKSGSFIEIWVDGGKVGSGNDLCARDVHNILNVTIGQDGNFSHPFNGCLGEIEIKQNALSSTTLLDIKLGYNYYVGNVFYSEGMIVLTSMLPWYQAFFNSDEYNWAFSAKGTNRIYEYEYICTVSPDEFMYSWNDSLLEPSRYEPRNFKDFVTGSLFTPYVSKIGLYNDNYELVATAKLSKPIPRLKNMDCNFIVRFDV